MKHRHVLIVEDNKINQTILERNLLNLGYSCETAENGIEALELCSKKKYDIIFMDLQMPKMGGIECTKKIRLHSDPDLAKIPIIAVTANVTQADRNSCFDAGMNGFLEKPLIREKLIGVLKELSL